MGFGIKLKVWGDYACFSRPEMKVERVSYDVMTPSAARGILDAIYWKPAIRWIIDRIHVINPIQFDNIRRNEVEGTISANKVKSALKGSDVALFQDSNADRQQRASYVLRNVCYCIDAHFEITDKAGSSDTVEKHYNVAIRRMRKGQFFHQPYFGCREFPVKFSFVEDSFPESCYAGKSQDLGFILYDIDFDNDMKAVFFRAEMEDGVIDIDRCLKSGGVS
ncbi:MAG: type I-C CRISPR-associated protein Cas5c [Methanospirillum sp.]|nr:type I-C CRISPR-associated protein Cas5c [Methanospirillum sp.]